MQGFGEIPPAVSQEMCKSKMASGHICGQTRTIFERTQLDHWEKQLGQV